MSKEVTLFVGVNDNLEEIKSSIPDNEPKPWDGKDKLKYIGSKVPRIDGHLKTSGKAKYTADVNIQGMLWARYLRSPYPSAIVKSINTSKAEKLLGVKAIEIVKDLPMTLRFTGQEILAVAAKTEQIANDALKLIEVEYEVLDFVVDIEAARKALSHQVHSKTVKREVTDADIDEGLDQSRNIRGPKISGRPEDITERDIDEILASCSNIIEGTYKTQVQTHSAMETHGVVAEWKSEDKLKIYASTQGTFSVRNELAQHFELPESNVQVVTEFMGGGFGAKLGAGIYSVTAAKLAKKANAPVRLILDRKEEHLCVGNRPSSIQKYKIGADETNLIKGIKLEAYGSSGIGTGAGSDGPAKNLYFGSNIYVSHSDIFTNAGPSAAFRAPGHPQGTFGLEQATDELAYKIGIDPLEFRLLNTKNDEVRQFQMKKGAEMIGWKKRSAKPNSDKGPIKRGFGFANSVWYYIRTRGHIVTITIANDGSVQLVNGVQDIGGGITTVLATVAAEELGLKPEDIKVKIGDTELGQGPSSGGSQTTPSLTPAARNAAYQAKLKLFEVAAPLLDTDVNNLEAIDGKIIVKNNSSKNITFKHAASKIQGSQITGVGERIKDSRTDGVRWWIAGAQFVDVSVDIETGNIKVNKIAAVHDCGRPMDRLTIESQINGGIIQGVSYALYEDRIFDRNTGIMVNSNFEQYKIAGAKEVPDIEIEIMDVNQGMNSTGAVGIGEPATIPTSAAIANAVYHAIGVRMRELPMTPDKVLNALYEGGAS